MFFFQGDVSDDLNLKRMASKRIEYEKSEVSYSECIFISFLKEETVRGSLFFLLFRVDCEGVPVLWSSHGRDGEFTATHRNGTLRQIV